MKDSLHTALLVRKSRELNVLMAKPLSNGLTSSGGSGTGRAASGLPPSCTGLSPISPILAGVD